MTTTAQIVDVMSLSGDGFGVDLARLTMHAQAVESIAEELETARAAAGAVLLGRGAYGQLCQFIPQLIEPLQDSAVDALVSARDAVQDTADGLRETARGYRGADQSAETRLTYGQSP